MPNLVHDNPPIAKPKTAITRAIDQELEWYFSYAETARRLGTITLLPTYLARQLADTPEDVRLQRSLALATTVQRTLDVVSAQQAGVLRAVYTPRRWPSAVVREFDDLAAIAVRLVCADNPWPARHTHDGLEQAAAKHLARMLARDAAKPAALRDIRNTARRLMGSAITAYVRARAKGASLAQTA